MATNATNATLFYMVRGGPLKSKPIEPSRAAFFKALQYIGYSYARIEVDGVIVGKRERDPRTRRFTYWLSNIYARPHVPPKGKGYPTH